MRPGGSRRLRGQACAERAEQVPVRPGVLDHLGPGRRFGAEAPHRQRGAGRAGPRGQGPLPAAGGPVPGPDGGLGHHRGDCGHPCEGPGGPGPVQGQKKQLQLQPGLAGIASHPGIVAPAAGARQTPGLPPPGRCRPAGPGRQYSGPALAAGGRHGLPRAGGAKGKLTEAQAAELEEVQGLPDIVPRGDPGGRPGRRRDPVPGHSAQLTASWSGDPVTRRGRAGCGCGRFWCRRGCGRWWCRRG